MKLCDYGCGQEAQFRFKNGKWCCSKYYQSCPAIIKRNNRITFKKIKKMFSNSNYQLLTTEEEYIDYPKEKIRYKCSKEHNCKAFYNGSKMGIRCRKCANEKTRQIMLKGKATIIAKISGDKTRTPFEEIENFVKKRNHQLLSTKENYKNQFSKMWFKCPKGHKFYMRYDTFLAGYNCPECFRQWMLNGGAAYCNSFIKNPSKPQIKLFNLCQEILPYPILNYPCLNYSIDIAIPKLSIAIEYDGSHWHQNKQYDLKRQKELEKEGWKFLRYRDYVPSKKEILEDLKIM